MIDRMQTRSSVMGGEATGPVARSARMIRHGRTAEQTAASNRAGALAKRKAHGITSPEAMQKATAASNRAGALAKRKANGIVTPEQQAAATKASNIAGQKAKNAAKKKPNPLRPY